MEPVKSIRSANGSLLRSRERAYLPRPYRFDSAKVVNKFSFHVAASTNHNIYRPRAS